MTERATLFPLRHLRVRMPLSDGHMDVYLAPDASSETIAAVTRGGRIPFPQPSSLFSAAPLRGCTCPICMAARMQNRLKARRRKAAKS